MFGFLRFGIVSVGSLVMAIGALNRYVGYRTGEDMLAHFPGYPWICTNPGLAGAFGAICIIGAFVFPSGVHEAPAD